MAVQMTGAKLPSLRGARRCRPQVGVPFRRAKQEAAGKRPEKYLRMVEEAGGQPVVISLGESQANLKELARRLDAFVLPGSSADVDPSRYHARRHPRCAEPDPSRERTDCMLFDSAFSECKPVLAICYGLQSLNVYLGGTLVQDIPSELRAGLRHDWSGSSTRQPEPFHALLIEPGSCLAEIAGTTETRVNSSHHQAVRWPGRGLRVVARAPDGVVEALELSDGLEPPGGDYRHWVMGVQWHPERMPGDAFAIALFSRLLAAAARVAQR